LAPVSLTEKLGAGEHSLMAGLNELTAKFQRAFGVLRNEGMGRLAADVRDRAELELELFPARKVDTVVLDGCAFNLKMIPRSRLRLQLLKGTYEDLERRLAVLHVDPELPLIELGACIGVVACVTNRLLKNPRAHVVLEANPNVLPILEENRKRNGCAFEIVNAAIAYDRKSVPYFPSGEFQGGSLRRLNRDATAAVPTISLREIADERGFASFTLICDIEGHECELVAHEEDSLQKARVLILETHARMIGEEKNAQMLKRLEASGFRIVDAEAQVLVLKR
jgi:FkbM family methyltransferase